MNENTAYQKKPAPAIAFLGGGNMAQAMLSGLSAEFNTASCAVWEKNRDKQNTLASQYQVSTYALPGDTLQNYPIWLLAVKPQDMSALCEALSPFYLAMLGVDTPPLIISIAAGVPSLAITKRLMGGRAVDDGIRIVRVMPNTPAAIGEGVSGMWLSPSCHAHDKASATLLLQSMGTLVEVANEADINAVTAISGSGTAYYFYFTECLQKSALSMGLSVEVAEKLAKQTFIGAAKLALSSPESLTELRTKVTSKGGTTEQALLTFQSRLPTLVLDATNAAKDRALLLEKSF